jgi:hypothetical protein
MGGGRTRRGYTLATLAVCLPVLVAGTGLIVDAGRLLAAKAELQAFVDAAALAAAAELDGTTAGLARARAVAISGPAGEGGGNRWNFGTLAVDGVSAGFARTPSGPFEPAPATATNYRFVRVDVTGEVPLYFLPILPGVGRRQAVPAHAIAGQARQTALGPGLAPFSPDAHDPSDPDFGFTRGELYTLKWPPAGQRKPANLCPGDRDFTPAGGSSDRGYLDVGQGGGNQGIHDAVVDNEFFLPQPIEIGSRAMMVTGNKHVGPAINERFAQDTDQSATSYSAYRGNGRRLIIVAVNDSSEEAKIIGFALFFLPPLACGHGNVSACCAEYVGPALFGGRHAAAGPPGLYVVRLFE